MKMHFAAARNPVLGNDFLAWLQSESDRTGGLFEHPEKGLFTLLPQMDDNNTALVKITHEDDIWFMRISVNSTILEGPKVNKNFLSIKIDNSWVDKSWYAQLIDGDNDIDEAVIDELAGVGTDQKSQCRVNVDTDTDCIVISPLWQTQLMTEDSRVTRIEDEFCIGNNRLERNHNILMAMKALDQCLELIEFLHIKFASLHNFDANHECFFYSFPLFGPAGDNS